MKLLMWIVIVFLVAYFIFSLGLISMFTYFNSASANNAKAINHKLSNQYYIKKGKVIYVRDGSFFVIGEKDIQEADLDTFEVINEFYAKDINHIYYNGEVIIGSSPISISVIPSNDDPSGANSGYIINGETVLCYGEEIKQADPLNFSHIDGGYAMDNNYVYYYYDDKIPLKETPIILTNNYYLKHAEQVLYQGKVISKQANHFEIINEEYSKDLDYVYSYGQVIEGAEPSSFEVLSSYFRKDKNQAYYFNNPIKNSDPASFKILNDLISTDQRNIYYESYLIQNKHLSNITVSDANNLENYSKWGALHLDKSTVIMVKKQEIEPLTHAFSTYNNEVYGRFEKLEGVKPNDVFIYDNEEFVKIGNKVFHNGVQIPDADADTFSPIASNFSKDKKHVYWLEYKVVDVDPLTFNYETGSYAAENEAGEHILKKMTNHPDRLEFLKFEV